MKTITREITHVDTLCVFVEESTYTQHADAQKLSMHIQLYLEKAHMSVDQIWVHTGIREYREIYESLDFSISKIPQTLRFSDAELFGEDTVCRLGDIRYVGNKLTVFKDSEMRRVKDFEDLAIVYYSWPGGDDARQLVSHFIRKQGPDFQPRLHDIGNPWILGKAKRVDVQNLLDKHLDSQRGFQIDLHRNTAPLIMHEVSDIKKVKSMCGHKIDAQEIQALYRIQAKGGRKEKRKLMHTQLERHHFVDEHEQITESGKQLLRAMHPSAYDPKFLERTQTWFADWEKHRPTAERWVRTWAGRLRRLQAKRWKWRRDFDAQAEALMAQYEQMRTRSVSPVEMCAIISSRHFRDFKVKEYTLCEKLYELAMRMNHFPQRPLGYSGDVIKSVLGERPAVDSSYFWTQEVKDLSSPSLEDEARMRSAWPDLWADGVNAALSVIREGGCTLYSVLDAPMPTPQAAMMYLPELLTPVGPHDPKPNTPDTDQSKTTYAFGIYVISNADSMSPENRAAHLAFRRGASAVWHALTIDPDLSDHALERARIMAIGSVRLADED